MLKNFEYCKYTYLHRKALTHYIEKNKYLEPEEKKALLERARVHDIDKLTLYLFRDKEKASKYHRENTSHHIKSNTQYSELDLLESIFDYECAALTKPDKPLNAYDTVIKYYSEFKDVYLPELKRLHMDSSYLAVEEDDKLFIENIGVTEVDILHEVSEYLKENQDNVYVKLWENLCSEDEYNNLIKRSK